SAALVSDDLLHGRMFALGRRRRFVLYVSKSAFCDPRLGTLPGDTRPDHPAIRWQVGVRRACVPVAWSAAECVVPSAIASGMAITVSGSAGDGKAVADCFLDFSQARHRSVSRVSSKVLPPAGWVRLVRGTVQTDA